MILIISFVVAAIVGVLLVRKNIVKIKEQDDNLVSSPLFYKCLIPSLVIVAAGLFNPFKMERVDAGHVGIKVNLTGDNRGVSKYEYRTGWVIFNKWFAKLYEFPTFQQHIDYDEQAIITRGGFETKIKPSFNYTIKAGDVGDMFQNLRLTVKEIERQWLQTAIVGSVNDVANKWAVDSIFNHRENFESDIINEANKRVSRWFQISQLRTNITPPKELADAIVNKTKAIQDVQVAENQKLVAIAEAERKIAVARGDSTQMVINASAEAVSNKITAAGESEAIRLKQISITNSYIDYLKAVKWDGRMPQVQTSGSGGILFNLSPRE